MVDYHTLTRGILYLCRPTVTNIFGRGRTRSVDHDNINTESKQPMTFHTLHDISGLIFNYPRTLLTAHVAGSVNGVFKLLVGEVPMGSKEAKCTAILYDACRVQN